jgi:hypothetical protein
VATRPLARPRNHRGRTQVEEGLARRDEDRHHRQHIPGGNDTAGVVAILVAIAARHGGSVTTSATA